jgi:hypothetical protein
VCAKGFGPVIRIMRRASDKDAYVATTYILIQNIEALFGKQKK